MRLFCVGNNNIYPICPRLPDILSRNGRGLDLAFRNADLGQMPIEKPYETFYLFTIAIFVPFVAVCEKVKHERPNLFDLRLFL